MNATDRTVGFRYECQYRPTARCSSGDGRPTRKTCPACRGPLRILSGLFGVFAHTGDGRYPRSGALSLHTSARVAARAAGDTHVVRFLSGEALELVSPACCARIAEVLVDPFGAFGV